MQPKVEILKNPQAVARAAADEILRMIRDHSGPVQEAPGHLPGRHEPHEMKTIALSGGSAPQPLYELLGDPRERYSSQLPWEMLHWFWTDERFVPHDDPRSNFRMAHDAFLWRAPVPPANIHAAPTDLGSLESCADAYSSEIQLAFHSRNLDDVPRLDLVILGIGEDGHTASLFPGQDILPSDPSWVRGFHIPGIGEPRLSLMPRIINRAKNIILLATGAEKAEIVARVLGGDAPESTLNLIRPQSGRYLWLLDQEAASAWTGPRALRSAS